MSAFTRLLRGPVMARALAALGIDARRYWLLMDLFRDLSRRRDMFSQLGRDETTLQNVTLLYFAMASIGGILAVLMRPALDHYFHGCLIYTGLALFTVLLVETSNSLVNPVEGLVLAHQPINGATYTAAKMSHLLRIVVYLQTGLNAVPALGGLLLQGALWYYPLMHLAAALALGLVAALVCCGIFGWLIRFVPAPRLKAAALIAEALPIVVFPLREQFENMLRALTGAGLRWGIVLIVAGLTAFGLRALSGDYLVRVATILHGRSSTKVWARRARLDDLVARFFGQPGRAGFAYVSRMMLRDWQFRRQMLPVAVLLVAPVVTLGRDLAASPFGGRFAPIHMLPHFFGFALFLMCAFLVYGSDYQGAWIFLLVPAGALGGFAHGVYALLWIRVLVIPHAILLPVLAWLWGFEKAVLFLAYSLAVASLYLAVELRLIEGLPFGRQPDPQRNSLLFPTMIAGGIAMAIAVGLQYFFVFRSASIVAAAAIVAAAGAYVLTRSSLAAFETAIRFHLAEVAGEHGRLYQEVLS